MIRIVVIDDDTIIREGYRSMINRSDEMVCVEVYGDCESSFPNILSDKPDVILLDISLPGMSGIEAISEFHDVLGKVDIIMISIHTDDDRVFASLRNGASGYLTKIVTPARLINAIKEVFLGGAPMSTEIARRVIESMHSPNHKTTLTKREMQVLRRLCEGNSYKMIADQLCISVLTVQTHIKHIYRKLQVHSQTEAVSLAIRKGMV